MCTGVRAIGLPGLLVEIEADAYVLDGDSAKDIREGLSIQVRQGFEGTFVVGSSVTNSQTGHVVLQPFSTPSITMKARTRKLGQNKE